MDAYTQHLIDSASPTPNGEASHVEGGSKEGGELKDEVRQTTGAAVGLPNQTADRPHQITQVGPKLCGLSNVA